MDEHTRYEVGRFYMVPHVRTKWPGYGNPNWIPIIGPSHTDLEVIGFEHEHWHVDFRFLSAALKRRSRRYHVPGAEVFALPIIRVYPLKYIRGDGETCEWEDSVMVSDLAHKNLKRDSYLRFRRSKCKEQYPELPFPKGLWWQRDLEAAYSDTRLKPGLICPHRGADLSTFEPDEADCVSCPLHGLQWNVRTGELVPIEETAHEAALNTAAGLQRDG